MSGVALDVPVTPAQPSFLRLLWKVLLGYFYASLSLGVLYVGLAGLGLFPRPMARPGPFPVVGVWSLDADLAVATAVVLVAAWFISATVADAAREPVSFGVVAVVVAATGYAPYLALRPAPLAGVVALPVATWLIRRYAVGRTLPFGRPSWRVWGALAIIGFAVFASYQVYHPLVAEGGGGGEKGFAGLVDLWNPGWTDLTIVRVDGGFAGEPWDRKRLPYTVGARDHFSVSSSDTHCPSKPMVITFSVLGRTSTQSFIVPANLCAH